MGPVRGGASALALALTLAFGVGCRRSERGVAGTPGASADGAAVAVALAQGTLVSGGHDRTFLFYAPPSPSGALVVALHGRLGDGVAQDRLTHLSAVAAREGFALALPDGFKRSWHDARDKGPAAEAGYDDVAFLSELVRWFVAHQGVDPKRVFFTGMSNGGFMATTMACRAPDPIAAIAVVASTFPSGLEATCKPARPVPVMIVAGDDDPLVPYGGGGMGPFNAHGVALSAEESARFWATVDGCPAPPVTSSLPDTDPSDGTQTTLLRYAGCAGGAEVELFTVLGGGHTWPGGRAYAGQRFIGKVSRDWDASEEIWRFFATRAKKPTQ